MSPTIIVKRSKREWERTMQSTQAPHNMRGKLADVIRTKEEAADLAYRLGGRDVRPDRPILVERNGQRSVIVGAGEATASELSELAMAAFEKAPPDFDRLRERSGQMRREEVVAAQKNALLDRIKRHKQNPITDPPRQPRYYPKPRWLSGSGHKSTSFYDI